MGIDEGSNPPIVPWRGTYKSNQPRRLNRVTRFPIAWDQPFQPEGVLGEEDLRMAMRCVPWYPQCPVWPKRKASIPTTAHRSPTASIPATARPPRLCLPLLASPRLLTGVLRSYDAAPDGQNIVEDGTEEAGEADGMM